MNAFDNLYMCIKCYDKTFFLLKNNNIAKNINYNNEVCDDHQKNID